MAVRVLLICLAAVLLTGCAEPVDLSENVTRKPDGFFHGLLHGFILLFSFIGSLFSDNIAIYNANNTGGFYDFGFLVGASMSIGAGASSRSG